MDWLIADGVLWGGINSVVFFLLCDLMFKLMFVIVWCMCC